jgi:hypothetical protein
LMFNKHFLFIFVFLVTRPFYITCFIWGHYILFRNMLPNRFILITCIVSVSAPTGSKSYWATFELHKLNSYVFLYLLLNFLSPFSIFFFFKIGDTAQALVSVVHHYCIVLVQFISFAFCTLKHLQTICHDVVLIQAPCVFYIY